MSSLVIGPAKKLTHGDSLQYIEGGVSGSCVRSLERLGFFYQFHDRGELKPRTWQDAYVFARKPDEGTVEDFKTCKRLVIAAVDLKGLPGRWEYALQGFRSESYRTPVLDERFTSAHALLDRLDALDRRLNRTVDKTWLVYPPPTGGGSINLPFEQIPNRTAQFVISELFLNRMNAYAVHHPWQTISCKDKREMIEKARPLYPNCEIRVAQGSLFSDGAKLHSKFVVHIQDAFSLDEGNTDKLKVNTVELERQLNLPLESLKMYSGDASKIIGLEAGGISAFVHRSHLANAIVFHRSLFDAERRNPKALFDFAISPEMSILIQPTPLFEALKKCLGAKILLAP